MQQALALTQSMSVFKELYQAGSQFSGNLDFWMYTLKAMQVDTTSSTSECMSTYTTVVDTYHKLAANVADDTAYITGMQTKGQGDGSTVGFWVQKF